jgi:uncharacterized membrane protein YdbT with pleckstrin-like domain
LAPRDGAEPLRASFAVILWVLAMRYIDRILQPGEALVYSGRIHWVVYGPAMLLAIVALAMLTQIKTGPTGLSWLIASVAFWLAAGVTFASAWFRRWTTEIDVTDRRIVYKCGFIKRHTVEMNMDKVESVDVDQSIFGRLLNYGDVTIHGTGEGWEPLRNIGAPLKLRNHVTAR